MIKAKTLLAEVVAGAMLGFGLLALPASAATPAFGLQPFEYVGAAGDCGPGSPAAFDTVTARDGPTVDDHHVSHCLNRYRSYLRRFTGAKGRPARPDRVFEIRIIRN